LVGHGPARAPSITDGSGAPRPRANLPGMRFRRIAGRSLSEPAGRDRVQVPAGQPRGASRRAATMAAAPVPAAAAAPVAVAVAVAAPAPAPDADADPAAAAVAD